MGYGTWNSQGWVVVLASLAPTLGSSFFPSMIPAYSTKLYSIPKWCSKLYHFYKMETCKGTPLNPPPPPLAFATAPRGGSNPLEQYVRRCLFPTTQKNNSQECFAWLRHFALDCYFSVWFYGNTDGTKCPEGVQSARADTMVLGCSLTSCILCVSVQIRCLQVHRYGCGLASIAFVPSQGKCNLLGIPLRP